MIIYFCFVLTDLINNYKNIYSDNVCIVVFYKNCLYNGFYENCLHNDFSYELLVCDSFVMHIVAFFGIKKGYVYVLDKCNFSRDAFLIINVIIF